MSKVLLKFRGAAVLALGAVACACAQAAVLDFESVAPSLFDAGDSFTEGAYTWVVGGSYGAVDTVAGCFIATCPANNATQFYQGYNDTHVTLRRTDGAAFNLLGFDAGYIAPVPLPADLLTGRIQFVATGANGSVFGNSNFALSAADGSVPFKSYSLGSALAAVKSVEFFGCSFGDSGFCLNPAENQAQFALDNVQVTAVPEPATVALLAMGLAAIGWQRRRAGRSA